MTKHKCLCLFHWSTFNVLPLKIVEFKLNGSLEKSPHLHSAVTVLVHLRWAVPVNPYLCHKRVTTLGKWLFSSLANGLLLAALNEN